MIPQLLALAGLGALAGALAVLRSFGGRFRVGRLLASTPKVSVAEAVALARRGERRYVRVDGRIDADEEFEDEHHRPLVFRRTRLEARQGRGWRPFEDERRTVAFRVQEGLDAIEVASADLDEGLIVIAREAMGRAADLGERAPAELPPSTAVRARIEQVSSVEHASVLGVPVAGESGARLAAGLGRPLVLTTLEPNEAMRVLAEGRSLRPRLAAGLLVAAAALLAAAAAVALLVPQAVLAASPTAAPAGGDPRSSGEGPGLVGDPGFALLAVLAIGLLALVATLAWVRLTGGPARR